MSGRMGIELILTILLSGLFYLQTSWADLPALDQTRTKLKQVESQISTLKQTINLVHSKQKALNEALATTEKKIDESVQSLHKTQLNLNNQQLTITNVQSQINALNKKLSAEQQQLMKHLSIRYKIGEYQPIKWVLNQDDPNTISRILTYYQYLVHAHQRLIRQVDETKKELQLKQKNLQTELTMQRNLQLQLSSNQKKLEHDKQSHTKLIESIEKDIHNKQQSLMEYQRNRDNLSQLMQTLAQQSNGSAKYPFNKMRRKIPHPVQTTKNAIQSVNQGVTFYTEEGKVVTAVYPGRVVFSDWLKGYGLLLIVDHGQGFMTLYANNQSLFKRKGQTVGQGEQIATVGHSGGLKKNGLYFEIRYKGKALSPREWLS